MSVLDTQTKEIKAFEPGKAFHLYMASIAITPHVTLTEKRHYGSWLLAGNMDVLISLGKKGVILETIVARSSTADGIRLMRGIGFTEIPSITKRRNSIIKAEKSGLKEIIQYKQALQESGISDEVKSRYKAPPKLEPRAAGKTLL